MSTSTTTATMPVGEPEPRFDFPTWLPPMFVKELRQGLRTRGFVGSMVGFQAVMVISFVWAFAVSILGDSAAQEIVSGFFWGVLGVMLLIVTPLRAMAGLRQEIDAKTLDLLVLTNLTSWRIVLGKWTSLLAQAGLLVLALLPYGLVRYFFGAVDLVQDCLGLVSLYFGCAIITAGALWVSGLPRFVRVLLPIVLVVMAQGVGGFMFGGSMIGVSGVSTRAGDWFAALLALFNGVLILLFFLVQAVRRIAPPAENHSPLVRGLALLALAPVPALFFFGPMEGARVQLGFAVVVLLVVTLLEISCLAWPMGVHVRTWWRRRGWGGLAGRLVLPGWPSVTLFTTVWLALVAIGPLTGLIQLSAATPMQIVWLFALFWAGLVFPMVLLSFAPNIGRQSPLVYIILQASFGIMAIMQGNASPLKLSVVARAFEWLVHVLPITSFWLQADGLTAHPQDNSRFFVGQAVMLAVVIALAVWRMTPYWRWVATQAAFVRKETKTVAPTE